jgi:cytoskeletal protein CcmA (bactofilin family)
MFLKNNNELKIETIIGVGTELEGDIQTSESIRVDGKLKGLITAANVILGEHGVVVGDISANKVTISGKIKGNINAATMIEILPKGHVVGDIRTSKLLISDGARFEGNSQMVKADGQVIDVVPQPISMKVELPNGQKNLKVANENGKH